MYLIYSKLPRFRVLIKFRIFFKLKEQIRNLESPQKKYLIHIKKQV